MTSVPSHRCKAKVVRGRSWTPGVCQRAAVRDGYCAQHHPDAVAWRDAERAAKALAAKLERAVVIERVRVLGEAALAVGASESVVRAAPKLLEALRELTSWDWAHLLVDHPDSATVLADVRSAEAAVASAKVQP